MADDSNNSVPTLFGVDPKKAALLAAVCGVFESGR